MGTARHHTAVQMLNLYRSSSSKKSASLRACAHPLLLTARDRNQAAASTSSRTRVLAQGAAVQATQLSVCPPLGLRPVCPSVCRSFLCVRLSVVASLRRSLAPAPLPLTTRYLLLSSPPVLPELQHNSRQDSKHHHEGQLDGQVLPAGQALQSVESAGACAVAGGGRYVGCRCARRRQGDAPVNAD